MENGNDNLAEILGRAISKSSHLRVLKIAGSIGGELRAFPKKWASFFVWLAYNSSVEYLGLKRIDINLSISNMKIDIFRILAPFFERYRNLRCIDLIRSNSRGSTPSLMSALSQMEVSRLQRIDLLHNNAGDENISNLINALNAMNGLCNLLDFDLSGNGVQRKGVSALSTLLTNPECRICYLGLSFNRFDVEYMGILVSGLAKCSCLKTLDLWSPKLHGITQTGWQILFIYLSSPLCSLNTIKLSGHIGDESVASLGASLATNQNLTSLYTGCYSDSSITATGYQEFSKCLKAPSSALVERDLSEALCYESDAAVLSIFEALVHNITLKKLRLVDNPGITATGWATCFQVLVGSQCAIEELGLGYNHIDDEGASLLVNLLSKHMSTVRILDIEYNFL